jgi:hypothetical protein
MEVGELFYIENPSLNLEERVLWAAERYQKKFGQQPTLCMLHPSLLKGGQKRLGRLRLEAKKSVLPNYLWIGVPVGEKSLPMDAKPFAL